MKAWTLGLRSLTDSEDLAEDGLALYGIEPDLDEVDPGGVVRSEMHRESSVLGKPVVDLRVLVCSVVVHCQGQLDWLSPGARTWR